MFMKSRNLIAGVVFLCASSLVAQSDRANLNGTVTGPKGPVANATVEVTSTRTGLRRQTQTGEKGEYTLPGLPIGHYTVIVAHEGDKTVTAPDIDLSIGQTLAVDVALGATASTELAATSETAAEDQVRPVATPLDTSSAQLGMVVAGDQIRNIPLNGRDWSS